MVTLSNVATSDNYTDAATLELEGAASFTFDIYNASAYASWRPRTGGVLQDYSLERLYGPLIGGYVTGCDGIRFRSAVVGSPARVVASGFGPADVQVIGGTPNTSALTAGGSITTGVALTGRVNGDASIAGGTGFSVVHTGVGVYTLTFTTAFPSTPVIVVDAVAAAGNIALVISAAATGCEIDTYNSGFVHVDSAFNFLAQATV